MLKNVLEFFRNLPPKTCCDCKEIMTEQSESYLMQCDKCQNKEK